MGKKNVGHPWGEMLLNCKKTKANYAMTQLNLINVSENTNHTAHLLGYSICMKLQRQQRQISICMFKIKWWLHLLSLANNPSKIPLFPILASCIMKLVLLLLGCFVFVLSKDKVWMIIRNEIYLEVPLSISFSIQLKPLAV